MMIHSLESHKYSSFDDLVKVDSSFLILNHQLEKGKAPTKLDTQIQEIMETLNRIKEEKKEEELFKRGCLLSSRTWTWVGASLITMTGISAIAQIIATGFTSYYQNSINCPLPNYVIDLGITSSVLAGSTAIYSVVYNQLDQGRKHILLEREKKVKEAIALRRFMKAYSAFIKEKEAEELNQKFEYCVSNLKSVSQSNMPIPARDRWVSALIQILPDGSPLKEKLKMQHKIAAKLAETRKTDQQRKKIAPIIQKGNLKEEVDSEGSYTFATESDLTSSNYTNEEGSESDDTTFLSTSFIERAPSSNSDFQLKRLESKDDLEKEYKKLFKELQESIGIDVETIYYAKTPLPKTL